MAAAVFDVIFKGDWRHCLISSGGFKVKAGCRKRVCRRSIGRLEEFGEIADGVLADCVHLALVFISCHTAWGVYRGASLGASDLQYLAIVQSD